MLLQEQDQDQDQDQEEEEEEEEGDKQDESGVELITMAETTEENVEVEGAKEEAGKEEEEEIDGGENEQRSTPAVVALAVTYPLLTYTFVFLVALAASYFSLPFFSLDNPLVGLRIRDDIVAERADAWIQGLGELRPDSGNSNERQAERTSERNTITILYQAENNGENVFTPENIQKMIDLEERILESTGFESYCLFDVDVLDCAQILSPLRWVANATTEEEIEAALIEMWQYRNADKDSSLIHFGLEFDPVNNVKTKVTRTVIRLGVPLEGYLNRDDRTSEQDKKVLNWLLDGDEDAADDEVSIFELMSEARSKFIEDPENEMVVTFFQFDLFNDETLVILGSDLSYAIFSLLCVVIITTLHLDFSVFLAVLGIVQVILSFPVCFFIYRLVFGIELFSGLNIISFYLLLGIGMDDIFIMSDAFRQSRTMLPGPGWTFPKRLAWAFHRAAYTMFATTVTTGFAFLMLASSKIPIVRYFGIFTSLLLFVNFALVTTMYLATLVFHHRLFDEGKRWIPRLGCSSSKEEEESEESDKSLATVDPETLAEKKNNEMKLTPIPRFFRNVVARKIVNNRLGRMLVFVVFGIIIAIGIGFASQLEVASKALNFWEDDHPFGLYLRTVPEEFKTSDSDANRETITMVWGIEGIDRTGTKETIDGDYGVPIYNADFDLTSPISQQHLFDQCYKAVEEDSEKLFLKDQEELQGDATVGKCFMTAFALWRQARNETFPVPKPSGSSSGSITVDGIQIPSIAAEEKLEDLLLEFLGRPNFGPDFFASVGFERDSDGNIRIKFATQQFVSNTTNDDPYGKRSLVNEGWESHASQVNEVDTPAGEAYPTDFIYFVWFQTQGLFVNGVIISGTLSLLLAFLMTTFTARNWIVALYACLTILLVVVMVVASIVVYGFQLGSIESVLLTLVLGISVDYVLHIAIGYADAAQNNINSREEKVEHALTTIGTSVFAGALTSLLSGSMLLFTTITFFSKFGKILVVTVVFAYFFAVLLFPALLSQFGPVGTKGDVCVPKFIREGKIDALSSKSIKPRDPKNTKKIMIFYVCFMSLLIALATVTYVLRLAEKKDQEEQEELENQNTIVYDDSINMPDFDTLTQGEWTEMRPGGETICARGTPYAFFVRKGAPGAGLIVELEGGGACWNPSTCAKATSTFKDTVEDTRASFSRVINGEERAQGIRDLDGPYAEMTHVYIPYCTGDLHWGYSSVTYDSVKIEHRGSVNFGAVLDYLNETVPVPSRVLVTGCSAGAYGSLFATAHIAKLYEGSPSTRVVQMGDAGMGVISDDFLVESFPSWDVLSGPMFPDFILPAENATNVDVAALSLPLLYRYAAIRFPNVLWSQFSAAYDWNQAFFLLAQKAGEGSNVLSEDKLAWNEEMNFLYDQFLSGNPSNLLHLVGPGDYHCNIVADRHYNVESGDGVTPFYKVLYDMFVNDVNPGSIDCRNVSGAYCQLGVDLREDLEKF